MTVSWYGMRGGRSRFQSKYGFTTTERGTYGAESALFRRSGGPNWYENTGWPQLTRPSIALAYGSISSLCGLQRFPSAGWYGPCTRYPYRWPGLTPGRYPCQTNPSTSCRSTRVSVPSSSNRQSSTRSATSENSPKLVPAPSYVAPSG